MTIIPEGGRGKDREFGEPGLWHLSAHVSPFCHLGTTIYYIISCYIILYHTGVCGKHNPFTQALAVQSRGRNCNSAPDLVLWKLVFPHVLLSGGVFFHRRRYGWRSWLIIYWHWRTAGIESQKRCPEAMRITKNLSMLHLLIRRSVEQPLSASRARSEIQYTIIQYNIL